MHDEATKLYELHGIPVRLRFDGDRYFVDDDIVDLYGTGATQVEAQEDYWLAVQEACADLTTDQDRLAPYLQDQLSFLLIRQGLASG
jgi:hypothetical protein